MFVVFGVLGVWFELDDGEVGCVVFCGECMVCGWFLGFCVVVVGWVGVVGCGVGVGDGG